MSPETARRLQTAYDQRTTYRPNDTVRAQVADITFVSFVGGVAVGKNYLMHQSGFHIVGAETSRKLRSGDDPAKYSYVTNEFMLDAIDRGEYVEYGAHPPDVIYAVRPEHLEPNTINVRDIWSDAIPMLYNVGFQAVKVISVLIPGEQWQPHLDDRFYDRSSKYVADRLSETKQSIKWSLGQHQSKNPDHLLIVNDDTQSAGNIERIRAFAQGDPVEPLNDDFANEIANQMFDIINNYQHPNLRRT